MILPAVAAGATALQAADSIVDLWKRGEDTVDKAKNLKAVQYAGGLLRADSLISYTQSTRVEPIALIDQRVQHVEYLNDVQQSLLALFAGYYLQAVALSVNIGGISPGKLLNHLNPTRPFLESLNAGLECFYPGLFEDDISQQFRFGLPGKGRAAVESLHPALRPALEDAEATREAVDAVREAAGRIAAEKKTDNEKTPKERNSGLSFSETDLKSAADLSVGRLYNVDITDGPHKATIPVMIRLLANYVSPDLLVHILSDGAHVSSSSAKERWYGWKEGRLKFWRDLVFCQDLIDEHKAALAHDSNGVYKAILKRRAGNAIKGIATAQPTVGTASNLMVVSNQTIKELEARIGGKFSRFEVRQKVFESSYLMIVAVIHPEYDHVTFYHRGIETPSEMSRGDVKKSSKGSGPDVGQILQAFMMGRAP